MKSGRWSSLEREKAIYREQASASGKPADIVEKIVSGKLNKWYEEHTLLEQPFVKDDSQTVGELVNAVSGVLGEKIRVRRYVKFALGEG